MNTYVDRVDFVVRHGALGTETNNEGEVNKRGQVAMSETGGTLSVRDKDVTIVLEMISVSLRISLSTTIVLSVI